MEFPNREDLYNPIWTLNGDQGTQTYLLCQNKTNRDDLWNHTTFLWWIFLNLISVYSITDWQGGTTLKSKATKSQNPKTQEPEKSFRKFLLLIIEYDNKRIQNCMNWPHSTIDLLIRAPSICAQPQKPWKTAVLAIFSSLRAATTSGWSRPNPVHINLIDYT